MRAASQPRRARRTAWSGRRPAPATAGPCRRHRCRTGGATTSAANCSDGTTFVGSYGVQTSETSADDDHDPDEHRARCGRSMSRDTYFTAAPADAGRPAGVPRRRGTRSAARRQRSARPCPAPSRDRASRRRGSSICPTPGRVKTRSITTMPAMRLATCTPRIEMIGREALRSPCRHSACVRVKPFARAVRMYSWCSTSSVAERTKRNRTADCASASVTVGSTSAADGRHRIIPAAREGSPVPGRSASWTANSDDQHQARPRTTAGRCRAG